MKEAEDDNMSDKNGIIVKTCFVSDSDGCIYKEGTREECESYVSEERESGMLEFLPPLSIYTKEEWFYFFGAIE